MTTHSNFSMTIGAILRIHLENTVHTCMQCRWRHVGSQEDKPASNTTESGEPSFRPEGGQGEGPECSGQWLPPDTQLKESKMEKEMVRCVQPRLVRVWETRRCLSKEKHHATKLQSCFSKSYSTCSIIVVMSRVYWKCIRLCISYGY